ncbi:hypothetical protein [Streptomyces sennicomposti]|uniref:hypothetical protein n=1 Tax=Streptomyces sennicomposti TaxID=2873384 RepID=UPI001CA6AC84|nr:hypothetical protein [Streptomyces sennicomposti]MBY8869344.1 hypothetical protein [Streptomyces sennicomposti]
MPTTHRGPGKRAAVLGSAFLAATVVLGPVGYQQAVAAPSETHVSTTAKAPTSDRDYQRGFKDGFKNGFRDGRHKCDHHGDHRDHGGKQALVHVQTNRADASRLKADKSPTVKKDSGRDYQRGYKDGYKSGFRSGQHC